MVSTDECLRAVRKTARALTTRLAERSFAECTAEEYEALTDSRRLLKEAGWEVPEWLDTAVEVGLTIVQAKGKA